MYFTLLQEIEAAIDCIAATYVHVGDFHLDDTGATPRFVHHYLLQEVTMIFLPIPNEKRRGQPPLHALRRAL